MSTTTAPQPDPPTPDPRAEVVPAAEAPAPAPPAEVPAVPVEPPPAAPKRRRKAAAEAPPAEAAAPMAEVPAEPQPAVPPAEPVAEAAPAPAPAPRRPRSRSAASARPEPAGETTDLQRALREAIAARGLDPAAAAAAIGVAAPGLRRVLAGTSRPNARTIGAYARWLGIDPASLSPAPAKPAKPAAPARPAIDVKAGFRALRELIAAAGAEPEVIEAEVDPALAALGADQLAWRVHRAPAAARKVVAAALATLTR